MHHKVIVIDGAVVVTGSYNFSKNANTVNDENCIIIHDSGIAKEFIKEYERLIN
jgi:phosphatidylserine/phosphatidylglycerophosphate/cardiolipin synthase-like enzyme